VPADTELVNVIGDMAGILPLKKKEREMYISDLYA